MFTILVALAAASPLPADHPTLHQCETVTTVNVVDIKPGHAIEARKYYETGWAAARKVALERGYISDYSLLVSEKGQSEEPEIVLITRYRDKAQFVASEDRFQSIFGELDLPRPFRINGLDRADILGPFKGADDYRTVFSASSDCVIPGHSAR